MPKLELEMELLNDPLDTEFVSIQISCLCPAQMQWAPLTEEEKQTAMRLVAIPARVTCAVEPDLQPPTRNRIYYESSRPPIEFSESCPSPTPRHLIDALESQIV